MKAEQLTRTQRFPVECLALFAHPSPSFVSDKAAIESWKRGYEAMLMGTPCRKTTNFHRDEQKNPAAFHQQKLKDDFSIRPPQFSRWHHCGHTLLPLLLQACGHMLGWELPGDKGWAPISCFSLPISPWQDAHLGTGHVKDWGRGYRTGCSVWLRCCGFTHRIPESHHQHFSSLLCTHQALGGRQGR